MPTWLETLVSIITPFAMFFGLFGLIMPVFPGLVIIWLAALGFGIVHGFSTFGGILFAIMTLLMVVGNISDGIMMGKKSLEYGAAKSSLVIAAVVSVGVSLFMSPLAGLVAAPFALYFAEKRQGHTPEEAKTITKGLMVGWGWGFVLRFGAGLIMIGLWFIWLLAS